MDGHHPTQVRLLGAVRRVRFSGGRGRCPRCRHPRFHRWGRFSGRQRYRCLRCKRTFSDLTGTPLHYSKRLALWDRYVLCILSSLSVRKAAAELHVDKNTAFRWRHLLLGAYRAREDPHVSGEVEAIRIRISCIGSPEPGRYRPTGRGGRLESPAFAAPSWVPRVLSGLLLYVRGRKEGREIELGWINRFAPPSQEDLLRELLPLFVPPVTLIGEPGPYLDLRPLALAACADLVLAPRRGAGGTWGWGAGTAAAPRSRPPSAEEVRPIPFDPSTHRVRAYHRRFRIWVARFFGVSQRYVANYFAWHRFLERSRGPVASPAGQGMWAGDGPGPTRKMRRLASRFLLGVCAPSFGKGRRAAISRGDR